MSARNTLQSYGLVTRFFHWMTALLILTAIPLGLYANGLPHDTAEALAWKAQVFSLHKTLGLAAFLVALGRILWALLQVHPVPLHPERGLEIWVARLVHWSLYISMLTVPLSGWVHHAAVTGFAPILWPFGQGLPFVPKSEGVAGFASGAHWIFSKLLIASILLHVAGALKHHFMDRDGTLLRMTRGAVAPSRIVAPRDSLLPFAAAAAMYAFAAGVTVLPRPDPGTDPVAAPAVAPVAAPVPSGDSAGNGAANWQVSTGMLALSVRQMGQQVEGSFGQWAAEIAFDETVTTGPLGRVSVTVDTGSLTLGSVSEQAKGKDFLDAGSFPQALFKAEILAAEAGYLARGSLTLRGAEVPLDLPFTLRMDGDKAFMSGTATLDRRAYGIGQTYADEATLGFAVDLRVELEAKRAD